MTCLSVTIAYVIEPTVKVSTPLIGELSLVNPLTPSVSASFATMSVGSLTSIICTPESSPAVTIAYVLVPITNVSTPVAPSSTVNPLTPSVSASFATMSVGSLTS